MSLEEMNRDIFGEYDIMDKATKHLVRYFPINKPEIYFLLELQKQETIYKALTGIGFGISMVVVLLCLV